MVTARQMDLVKAIEYKKRHPAYAKSGIRIKEVWRDNDGILCVRYETSQGKELEWFHYAIDGDKLVWW